MAVHRGSSHPLSQFSKNPSVDAAIHSGFMFAGTPDQVYEQIKRHYEYVGGYGHLLIMGLAGFLEHDDTVKGIRNFAREVYPRLKEMFPKTTISGQYGDVPAAPPERFVLRTSHEVSTDGPLISALGGAEA